MKITNNYTNISNKPYFKAKIIQMPAKKDIQHQKIRDPEYFQALNGIKRENIKTPIIFEDGTFEMLEIQRKDVKKYLCDNKGFIVPDRVKEFSFLYRYIAQGMKNENKNEKRRYESAFERFNNVTNISNIGKTTGEIIINNLSQEEKPDEEFVSSIMCNLPQEQKNTLQDALLDLLEQEENEISNKAYQKTLRLFQLSKAKEGYNFSSLNSRLELIDAIDELSLQYGRNYSIDELYDDFITCAKDENGTIDFKLVNDTFEIIYLSGLVHSPKHIMNLIKKYTSKNPHNRDEIVDTMKKLNNTDFIIDPNETVFEDLMDLCFNGFHFNSRKANKLIELADYSKNWINSAQMQKAYLGIDRAISRYDSCVAFCKQLIMDYFNEYMDNESSYQSDEISIEKYFAIKTNGISFI